MCVYAYVLYTVCICVFKYVFLFYYCGSDVNATYSFSVPSDCFFIVCFYCNQLLPSSVAITE